MRLNILAAAALFLCASAAAKASTLYYTFTGTETSGTVDTLTFSISSSGPWNFYRPDEFATQFLTQVKLNTTTDSRTIGFFASPFGVASDQQLVTAVGGTEFALDFVGALFSGSEPNPTLLTGTFALDVTATDIEVIETVDYSSGQLVVSTTAPVTATPEPSSLALLGTGLLGCVGVVKRRLA